TNSSRATVIINELNRIAGGSTRIALQQPPDLPLKRATRQNSPGTGDTSAHPLQPLLDTFGEARVNCLVLLAPLHLATQQESLAAVGSAAELSLPSFAHALPILGVGNLPRPSAQFAMRCAD